VNKAASAAKKRFGLHASGMTFSELCSKQPPSVPVGTIRDLGAVNELQSGASRILYEPAVPEAGFLRLTPGA
jgi:hypothetical protein